MIANVEIMGLLHDINPLLAISFITGNMMQMIDVVGSMKKMGLDAPTAVAAQEPDIDVTKSTVRNANVTVPTIHTSPGLEGK
jgi:hypothetical protein